MNHISISVRIESNTVESCVLWSSIQTIIIPNHKSFSFSTCASNLFVINIISDAVDKLQAECDRKNMQLEETKLMNSELKNLYRIKSSMMRQKSKVN